MGLVVLKFGGTSLGTPERMHSVAKIISDSAVKEKVVVVVSAISSHNKAEGTTSKLIKALEKAERNIPYVSEIDEIESNHLNMVAQMIDGPVLEGFAKEEIKRILGTARSFLGAIHVVGEITPRMRDAVVGSGERLSAILLSTLLRSKGFESEVIDLSSIIPTHQFKKFDHALLSHAKQKIKEKIESTVGIPVITGYFGFVPYGIERSIGRGYTDFTASLASVALGAYELQIWKEVDGIFTTDPRKVKTAHLIHRISPAEASELTLYGSEVIHPMTMEQVINAGIPVRIKNTLKPEGSGTIVDPDYSPTSIEKRPTAVTAKSGILVINVCSNRMLNTSGFMSNIFKILDQYNISVDLISTSEVNVSMTVDKKININAACSALKQIGEVNIRKDLAIVSLVGEGMRETIGTAAHFFNALAEKGINIEMISQGASEINISCVIEERKVLEALNAIHIRLLE